MTRVRRLLLLLACLSALAGSARAHSGHPILRAERTIKVTADGRSGLVVVVTLNFGPDQMLGRVRRADADSNGRVDETEASRFLRDWGYELRDDLPVYVDGERVRLSFTRPFFEPKGPVAMQPGTLEIVGEVPLSPGHHDVFLADRMASDEFDRTDVMFEVTNGATLVASGPSASPTEVVPSFAYGVATETRRVRSIGASVDIPERTDSSANELRRRRLGLLAFVVFGGSLFAVALARLVRALRARDARRGLPD